MIQGSLGHAMCRRYARCARELSDPWTLRPLAMWKWFEECYPFSVKVGTSRISSDTDLCIIFSDYLAIKVDHYSLHMDSCAALCAYSLELSEWANIGKLDPYSYTLSHIQKLDNSVQNCAFYSTLNIWYFWSPCYLLYLTWIRILELFTNKSLSRLISISSLCFKQPRVQNIYIFYPHPWPLTHYFGL